MLLDIIICSVKELVVNNKRTILSIFAVITSTIFMILLYGSGDSLNSMLYKSLEDNASANQIVVLNDKSELTQEDAMQIKNDTNSIDMRIYLLYNIVDIKCDGLFSFDPSMKFKLIDSKCSFLTYSEIISAINIYNTDYSYLNDEFDGVYISEDFLDKRNVSADEVIGKIVQIDLVDRYGKNRFTQTAQINGIVAHEVGAVLGDFHYADIYIASKNIDAPVKGIYAITYDYGNYDKINSLIRDFNKKDIKILTNDSLISNTISESIIYNVLFIFAMVTVLVASFLCLYNSINISFRSRIKHYGILKAIGFSNIHIYLHCIIQSVIINVIGLLIGIPMAIYLYKYFGMYLAKSIEPFDTISAFKLALNTIIISAAIIFASGIMSGVFPAFSMSRYLPIKALAKEK